MNTQELTTWQRLLVLDLDASDAVLPFSKRVARENGWSESFARGAIEEYRKFCFLAVHAGHPVTPSDEVDQVWHLHMLYSRHYWDALCRDTLGMPLHHGPTEGGAAEGRKFHAWYEHTLAAYRRYFGAPPEDFWPAAGERFDPRHDFVRADRRDVVLLDRVILRRAAGAAVVGSGVLAMAHAFAQAGAADHRAGSPVQLLIIVLMVMVAVIGVSYAAARGGRAIRRKRRRGGDAGVASYVAAGGGTAAHCPPGSVADSAGHCADGGGGGAGCGAGGCGGGGCGGGGCGGGS